ncbi:glycerophosphodiester phosphodiesterase family protein [Reichenbachiella sp. MALMAid0571]|uniref:glycerophosphodiester phosphodiesterase family protein n=1 Tax=Reichenbachiella sp. MALMAid0571 TaxID=3143939 RepID=UPI0032DE3E8C
MKHSNLASKLQICIRNVKRMATLLVFLIIGIKPSRATVNTQTSTHINLKLIDLVELISDTNETYGIRGTVGTGGHAKVTLSESESGTLIYEVELTSSSIDDYSGTATTESLFHSAYCTFWNYFGYSCDNSDDYYTHYKEVVGPVLEANQCWDDPDFANCYGNTLLEDHTMSLIVKLETDNASITGLKLPGLGELNPGLLFNSYTKLRIQGSNYEFKPLILNRTFGYDNSASVTNIANNSLFYNSGLKFTAPYDNLQDPNDPNNTTYWTSYSDFTSTFKIHFDPQQNVTFMAYGRNTTTSARTVSDLTTALGSPSGLSVVAQEEGTFKITYTNLDNTTLEKTFDVFKVVYNSPVVYTASAEGPFAMAHEMDNTFLPNDDMASKKMYNRYVNYGNLDDFAICAHRGIWDQIGSHFPIDYAGQAANTFATYEQALSGRFSDYIDVVEVDVRRSSDGVFVCNHDGTLLRVANIADDAECVSIKDLNNRSAAWKDLEGGVWDHSANLIKALTWNDIKDLHARDYLGCKVKVNGNYVNPINANDALSWMRNKGNGGLPTNLDFKDGLKYLDELYRLVLSNGMEGQVNFMFYVNDFTIEHYRKEYGEDFMRQISMIPNLYEPKENYTDPFSSNGTVSFGVDGMLQRFEEYLKYSVLDDYTYTGVILNMNNGYEPGLVELANTEFFSNVINGVQDAGAIDGWKIKPKWTFSHYIEPFMTSFFDRQTISIPRDCNPSQHLNSELCVNLFWRADYDWMINNGVNGLYSDGVESLVEYLIAKGKISRK